jgi:DNA processing protein
MTREAVALTMVEGVGPVTAKSLISHFKGAENVFGAEVSGLLRAPGVGETTAKAIVENRESLLAAAEKELEFCNKNGIRVLAYYDSAYPQDLKIWPNSPAVLYVKGSADLNQPSLAVVGTRSPSDYGKKQARRFASHWAGRGLAIVSGLAYGIDTEVHQATLEAHAATVAVLGHGLATVYPPGNKTLAERIAETGALVSEYPSYKKPDRTHFPHRNRIIAGMAKAVLVVEAGRGSGALNTAAYAEGYRKPLFAVPGRLGDPLSEGTNALIRDGKAVLATDPESVLTQISPGILEFPAPDERVSPAAVPPPPPIRLLGEHEHAVYELLKIKDCLLDELLEATGMNLNGLMATLMTMELQGIITQLPGRRFSLVK